MIHSHTAPRVNYTMCTPSISIEKVEPSHDIVGAWGGSMTKFYTHASINYHLINIQTIKKYHTVLTNYKPVNFMPHAALKWSGSHAIYIIVITTNVFS